MGINEISDALTEDDVGEKQRRYDLSQLSQAVNDANPIPRKAQQRLLDRYPGAAFALEELFRENGDRR